MALSPASSHGGGPAAGTYQPTANSTGVTVDTTTYADEIKGGGAKLTTLIFPGDQGALAVAITGDVWPRWLFASDPTDGFYLSNGAFDPYAHTAAIGTNSGGDLYLGAPGGGSQTVTMRNPVSGIAAVDGTGLPRLDQVSPKFTVVSGALPTVALVSGTGAQISTARDVETVTPVTFNPGAATTATVTVALSPDNVTYSTLGVETEPAGVAFDGTIHLIKVRVPAGWYLKLTVNAQAVLGTTTYY